MAENAKRITENIQSVFNNHAKEFWDDKKGTEPLQPLRFKNLSKFECEINEAFFISRIVNNIDWYKNLNALELIGKFGRHFRLGQMLGRQSVATRLAADAPISYTEFSYQVFQAYDWLHLFRNYGCEFQIGGHDQMGNIVSGHDLISRVHDKQVYGKIKIGYPLNFLRLMFLQESQFR